jgi:Na+/melibiose symporter-like transporter
MVQVSHMAMLPELTANPTSRVRLNSARYSATVGSNLFVFSLLAILVHADSLSLEEKFNALCYACLGVGLITSILFLLGTKDDRPHRETQLVEPPDVESARRSTTADPSYAASPLQISMVSVEPAVQNGESAESNGKVAAPATNSARPSKTLSSQAEWSEHALEPAPVPVDSLELQLSALPILFTSYRTWLTLSEFWCCAFVYMSARLIVNVSQTFLPLYVLDVLELDTIYITILPCVLYISSMLAALSMQLSTRWLGLKGVFFIGCSMTCVGLCIMLGLTSARPSCYVVYLSCILVGLGNGAIMVTATQLTSDLIGSRTHMGAFVVGSFACADKFSSGIVLFLLSYSNGGDSAQHVRLAVTLPPILLALASAAVVYFLIDLAEMNRRHTLSNQIRKAALQKSARG